MEQFEFTIGEQIQHAYTKEYLWVLRIGREQILCRTKDLREIWFYPYELERLSIGVRECRKSSDRFL